MNRLTHSVMNCVKIGAALALILIVASIVLALILITIAVIWRTFH